MSRKLPFHALLLAAALACPAAAQAATHLTMNFAGTVSPGSHGEVTPYLFEPGSTSFDGEPVSLTLSVTRDHGYAYVDHFSVSWSDDTYDLPFITSWAGEGVPLLDENQSFLGFFSIVDLNSNGGSISIFPTSEFHSFTDADFDLNLTFATSQAHDPFATFTDNAITGGGNIAADLTFVFADPIGPYDAGSRLNFTLSSLTQTAGVPEPSTWALLILGFAAIGVAGRRRQIRTAV